MSKPGHSKTAAKFGKTIAPANRELHPVRLGQMRVCPEAQREFNPSWADRLLAEFDPDKLGTPELSFRDGHYYVMDGQHRIEALKRFLGDGWEEQCYPCWVWTGLSVAQEADKYLDFNNSKHGSLYEKFKCAVTAGRPVETEIKAIVEEEALRITKKSGPGAVQAVGALKRVHRRDGADCLRRALRLSRDAYGSIEGPVLDGLGLLTARYNGTLNDKAALQALAKAAGGINALRQRAEALHLKTGKSRPTCIAAAAVEIINRPRRGASKLPDWWKA